MRLIKDIPEDASIEDKKKAYEIISRLKCGDRVFGNVAEGLKMTLKKTEEKIEEMQRKKSVLDYLDKDDDLKHNIALLKAGINGEEMLAEYFEKIIKHDEQLSDIILFASLSDPEQNSGGDDYISDSDFLAIYGNHILILDAKNIATNPEIPIYLSDGELCAVGGKSILELHSSVPIWRNILSHQEAPYLSIHGCTVIVNNRGACIWKNDEWKNSDVKPIHISELVSFLKEWISDKDNSCNLSLLTTISKMQIKKDKGENVKNITEGMLRNKLI